MGCWWSGDGGFVRVCEGDGDETRVGKRICFDGGGASRILNGLGIGSLVGEIERDVSVGEYLNLQK